MSIPPKRSAVASHSVRQRVEVAYVARLRDRAIEAEVVAASRREPDIRPALVQHPSDGGPDSAARARDHSSLAFEAHHVS